MWRHGSKWKRKFCIAQSIRILAEVKPKAEFKLCYSNHITEFIFPFGGEKLLSGRQLFDLPPKWERNYGKG